MDAKKTLEKLRGESERKTYSWYLSEPVTEDFKSVCEKAEVSASRVLEELMRDFVENARNSGKKRPIKKY